MTGSAVIVQDSFRYRNDDGSESGATWKYALNTDGSLDVNTNYRMRYLVKNTGTASLANIDFEWQYNLNGAGWNNITTTSAVVKAVADSGNLIANGADCTKQLGAGTFWTNNDGFTEDGISGGANMDLTNGQETETELCFQIVGADVANNDAVQMRLTRDGGALLNTYTRTLSITVSEASENFSGQLTVDVTGTAVVATPVVEAFSGGLAVNATGTDVVASAVSESLSGNLVINAVSDASVSATSGSGEVFSGQLTLDASSQTAVATPVVEAFSGGLAVIGGTQTIVANSVTEVFSGGLAINATENISVSNLITESFAGSLVTNGIGFVQVSNPTSEAFSVIVVGSIGQTVVSGNSEAFAGVLGLNSASAIVVSNPISESFAGNMVLSAVGLIAASAVYSEGGTSGPLGLNANAVIAVSNPVVDAFSGNLILLDPIDIQVVGRNDALTSIGVLAIGSIQANANYSEGGGELFSGNLGVIAQTDIQVLVTYSAPAERSLILKMNERQANLQVDARSVGFEVE